MCKRVIRGNDNRIKYVSSSRNFGKEYGVYAGLKNSSGNYVGLMDIDLQDFSLIITLNYDQCKKKKLWLLLFTRRNSWKRELFVWPFFVNSFYEIMDKLSDIEIVNGVRDFRIMNRPMINFILEISEYNRFSKGIFVWVRFEIEWLEYEKIERLEGESAWSFASLLR